MVVHVLVCSLFYQSAWRKILPISTFILCMMAYLPLSSACVAATLQWTT